MKKLYGLLALVINDIATFFLMWQFYYFETTNISIKRTILIVVFLLLVLINIRVIIALSKKIKGGLDPNKKERALKRIRKKIYSTNILLSISALLLVFCNYLYFLANQTLSTITLNMEPTELKIYIITSANSTIETLEDPDLITIGFDRAKDQYQSLFENFLEDQYDKYAYIDYQPLFQDYHALKDFLFQKEVDALFVCEDTYNALKKLSTSFEDDIRILESKSVKTSVASKPVNVTKDAFNVLILGVDIREDEGDIHTNTRTDTIMIASFNPKTMQASLISIPRDTYTPLSYNNQYDKLTHAALYGVGCTIETIEDLLDIDINYYAKFNFKALVGLVDAIGGIEVDVKFSFTESNSDDVPNSIAVNEGLQILNGEQALAYARHRNTQNDHVRNNSQQEVLQAILSKLTSFDTLTKVNELLKVLNTNMTTNFGREEIMDLVTITPKLGELKMETYVIEGEDYETYVTKYDENLWITDLSETSIQKAQHQIESVHTGGEVNDFD